MAARRLITLAAAAMLGMAVTTPADASEGGASLYLLGSGGPGAGALPPIRGIFFDNTFYYYDGRGSGGRQFVLGGNVVADLNATIAADFATILWVPTNHFLGGTLAVGAAFPVGRPDVDVGVVLTGPRGGRLALSQHDAATIVGDPVLTAALGWQVHGVAISASTMVNVPIGGYREDQLANLSFHRWAADFSLAATWHPVADGAGWDISGKAGITANGTNHYTDYNTGTEFHAEASIERIFSPAFSAGVQIYHFQQVTGDSGAGATLGPFEGRESGVGATAAYNFQIGHTPATARGHFFMEFGARNRLEGNAVMVSLTFPLAMRMPTQSE